MNRAALWTENDITHLSGNLRHGKAAEKRGNNFCPPLSRNPSHSPGPSMYPTLKPGDGLDLYTYNEPAEICVGDVIVYPHPFGTVDVVHRIIKIRHDGVITRGTTTRLTLTRFGLMISSARSQRQKGKPASYI